MIEADGFVTVHVWPREQSRGRKQERRFRRERAAVLKREYRTMTERLLEAAWRCTGIPPARVTGRERCQAVFRPRCAVCWALRECGGLGLAEIGRQIGDRDHTTILSAIKRAEEWRETDRRFRELCDRLEDAA